MKRRNSEQIKGNPKGAGFSSLGILGNMKFTSASSAAPAAHSISFLPKKSLAALLAAFAGAVVLAASAQSVQAATLFTEQFSLNNSNWTDNASTAASWTSSGGPAGAGDGYITATALTTGSGVVLRASAGSNASGGGFVGNWLSEGVATFSIDIFQDSGSIQNFGLRFASSANFPGASTNSFSVQSGVWTHIEIPIVASSFQTFEGSNFNAVFSSIGNVQVSTSTLPAATFHVSVDNASVSTAAVPEPTSLALLGAASVCGLSPRRRRKARA